MEIFKDVNNYEGLYQISNLGNVRSLPRKGTIGKILKPEYSNKGYLQVLLCKNGKGKWYKVHRLVWEAFNDTIPEGLQVNHINEIKTDNRLENLNLMTPKENNNWGTRNQRAGKALSKPVLQYDKQGNLVKEWPSVREIQRQLGYSSGNISMCCRGKFSQRYGYIWRYKN